MTNWTLQEWHLFLTVMAIVELFGAIGILFKIRSDLTARVKGSKELLQIGLNLQRLEERMDSHFARLNPPDGDLPMARSGFLRVPGTTVVKRGGQG